MILSRLSSNLVLLLAAVLIVVLAWWLRTRDPRVRRALIVAAVLFGLGCLYELLRPETPHEAMKRKIQAMAGAVAQKDLNTIFQHVSDEFSLESGVDKAFMRGNAQRLIDGGELTDVQVWGFKEAEPYLAVAA